MNHPLIESNKINADACSVIFAIKHQFSALLNQLEILLPEGREKSLVFTKIQEGSFFAVKAICVNEKYQEK